MRTVLRREFSWFARSEFCCCREVTNASVKMAFDGSIEQCPSLVSHPFLIMISFLSPDPPGYSKWTSFLHKMTLQDVPNVAKHILMSDPSSRVGVFGQTGPISLEQPDLKGTGVNVVFWQLFLWFGAPAIQYRPQGLVFSFLSAIVRTILARAGVTGYFDRAIQIPFLTAKWLNFEGL